VIAGLAAAVLLGDDLTLSRTSGRTSWATKPSARTMSITLQLPASDHADLRDARIAGAGGGVDLLAQRDLLGERDQAERIGRRRTSPGWSARRRRAGGALGGIEQLQRLGGALDRAR
jgi:hypothetical protein